MLVRLRAGLVYVRLDRLSPCLLLSRVHFWFISFLFFFVFTREFFHLLDLSRSKLRQMTNKRHEIPNLFRAVFSLPRRHPRQPNSIRHDVENFAVSLLLSLRLGHVRNRRIHTAADDGIAA